LATSDKESIPNLQGSKTDKRKQSLYFPESMLQEIKEEAARLDRSLSWVVQRAWKIDGVKQVYDEIQVGPDSHFIDEARDSVISTRLKTDLVWDGQVKSINYSIKTEDGVVYVMGSARSGAERDRVMDYARNIPTVRRVVDYVTIRSRAPPSDSAAASAPASARRFSLVVSSALQ